MYDQRLFLQTLSRFAEVLPARYDLDDALTELTASVTAVLGLCGSGVTLADDGRMRYVTTVTLASAELERDHAQPHPCPCPQGSTNSDWRHKRRAVLSLRGEVRQRPTSRITFARANSGEPMSSTAALGVRSCPVMDPPPKKDTRPSLMCGRLTPTFRGPPCVVPPRHPTVEPFVRSHGQVLPRTRWQLKVTPRLPTGSNLESCG